MKRFLTFTVQMQWCKKQSYSLLSAVLLFSMMTMDSQQTFCQQRSEELPGEVINFLEQLDPETEPAIYQNLMENLLFYLDHPLDINKVNADDLRQLRVLDELQVQAIVDHRERFGKYLRMEELQTVKGLGVDDIRLLQPFVKVSKTASSVKSLRKSIFQESSRALFLRYEKDFPTAMAYLGEEQSYEGNPDQLYLRLRWRYGTKFSTGFTAEKDHGESLFRKSNKTGFDYYSAHLYFRELAPWLNILAIGDYQFNLGQGLIRHSGFGGGKSSFVMNFNKGGRVITPYSSVDENRYLRGIATEFQIFDKLTLATAVSYRKRDGNRIVEQDTFLNSEEAFVSSLQLSGLHRTPSEIEDENSVAHFNAGARLKYKGKGLSIAANVWHDQLSDSLKRRPRPDNQFQFNGKQLSNASIDYQWNYKKFILFGEVAHSFPGSHAMVHGFLTSLHPRLDVGVLFRHLAIDYQVLNPNAFVDNTASQNERGLYLSTRVKLSRKWSLNAYADLWSHPWLRFRVDAPSTGREYFMQVKYYHKRKFESYLQYKRKTKEQNGPEVDKNSRILEESRESIRLHLAYQLNKTWTWRARAEWSNFYVAGNFQSSGKMLYQDIICKPLNFPLSFTARTAIFSTDDYDTRIYTYENDLLYTFSIPAFYRRGFRSYVNLRYRLLRKLTVEGRYAISYYPLEESIGSGNQEVAGSVFHGVKFQMRWAF